LYLLGCGGGEQKVNEAREAEWAWLVENKAKLDSLRQEVTELEGSIKAAPMEEEGEAEGEEEGAASIADLEQQLDDRREEAEALADTLMQRLVGYLNAEPMIEGEPLTESQLAAIRMKSNEDIVLAREYIQKGGDYRRAIDIYQTALQLDPDNEETRPAPPWVRSICTTSGSIRSVTSRRGSTRRPREGTLLRSGSARTRGRGIWWCIS
jgi:tetratricopeptide (TPR) repeat protein